MPVRSIKKGQKPNVADFDALSSIEAAPGVGGALSLLPVLISIYKNRAEREAATRAFTATGQQLWNEGREALGSAIGAFAERYPRVAAHMRINPDPISDYVSSVGGGSVNAHIHTPPNVVTHPMQVEFTQQGMRGTTPESGRDFIDQVKEAERILYHEGTHAAQVLGDRNFAEKYDIANKLVGYDLNPYEITATDAGVRRGSGSRLPIKMRHGTYSPEEQQALDRMHQILGLDQVPRPLGSDVARDHRAELANLEQVLSQYDRNKGVVPRTAPRMLQSMVNEPKRMAPYRNLPSPATSPADRTVLAIRGGSPEQTADAQTMWLRLAQLMSSHRK